MTTIDPSGRPVQWTALYYRSYCPYADEFDSAEDAVQMLEWGEDDGNLSTIGVLDPSGRIVHSNSIHSDPVKSVAETLRDLANVRRGREASEDYPAVLRNRSVPGN